MKCAFYVTAFAAFAFPALAQDEAGSAELADASPPTVFEVLLNNGPLHCILAALLVGVGLLHFGISIRSIGRPTPSLTVPHHLLFLFATPAIVFLALCSMPASMGGLHGTMRNFFDLADIFGVIGALSFVLNFLLALVAIYRRSRYENSRST